ncbi:MAG: ATP-binding cassette domain-containing protein, partial [Chloroflexota bacterium]
NDVPPKDRDIAMVFQSYALYPHMSVFDNMAFGLKLRKTPRSEIERRVKEAADILDIGNLLDRKPKQLSGGQRQRVAVGRAIVREPSVFLFDEPLSNLDAKLRVQTRAQLTRLHQRLETTFIYVTHDQVEALTMASRIAVMRDGILQQLDSPTNLYNMPTNVFVGGFIGSPSMNFFDATLVESDGKLEVNTGGFRLNIPEQKAAEWREHKGREVIFGIRPEDIHAEGFSPPGILEAKMSARVDVLELMGNEIFVYLMTKDEKQFIARVDPRVEAPVGMDLGLSVNMDNAHIFDPKTERSLLYG